MVHTNHANHIVNFYVRISMGISESLQIPLHSYKKHQHVHKGVCVVTLGHRF